MAINNDYLNKAISYFDTFIQAYPDKAKSMSFMFKISHSVEKLLVIQIKLMDPKAEDTAALTAQTIVHRILLAMHKQINKPPPNLV